MTEVSKMTDQQLNRALAELMGYSVGSHTSVNGNIWYFIIRPNGSKGLYDISEDEAFIQSAPNYCTDPAASLEVQAAACEKDPDRYIRNLEIVKWGQATGWKVSNKVVAQLCNATPRQRAEAAYMTLKGE